MPLSLSLKRMLLGLQMERAAHDKDPHKRDDRETSLAKISMQDVLPPSCYVPPALAGAQHGRATDLTHNPYDPRSHTDAVEEEPCEFLRIPPFSLARSASSGTRSPHVFHLYPLLTFPRRVLPRPLFLYVLYFLG